MDEVYFGAKGKFQTLVYQLCSAKTRLPFVADGRKEMALSGILRGQGEDWCAVICHGKPLKDKRGALKAVGVSSGDQSAYL